MKATKRIQLKIIVSTLICLAYLSVKRLFYPMLINEAVVSQFDNTAESFINIQAQQGMWQAMPIVILIVVVLIFSREIKTMIGKLIEETKEA